MQVELHPDISVTRTTIGKEEAPLLIVDNFVKDPDTLIEIAGQQHYAEPKLAYPGVRSLAPKAYQQLLLQKMGPTIIEKFGLNCSALRFTMCHYSLVTTPPENLIMVQRIPHVDSFASNGLATIHYLFREDFGGTDFYRHRKTGYEVINEARKLEYFASLESENGGPNMPGPEYINGDTPLFERVRRQAGAFNRLLVYRRNSLHSASISKAFDFNADPKTGRLSINSFIDIA